jgi:hypothetical protein
VASISTDHLNRAEDTLQPATRRTLTAMLIATAASACAEPTAPADRGLPELATGTVPGNIRLAFSLPDVDNPCTPGVEAIDLEGTIHGHGGVWDNGHFTLHYNLNVTGVDADGVRYEATSAGNTQSQDGGAEAGGTEDTVISTLIISLGGTPNFVSKIVVHHRSDGTLTFDRAAEACRGSN